jgi:hypothetical protein
VIHWQSDHLKPLNGQNQYNLVRQRMSAHSHGATSQEFAEGGDLLSLLKRDEVLGWRLRMRIMKDAAAGLQ